MKQMHFSIDEWQAFTLKTIDPEILSEMEIHLQLCDSCQEFYLDLIEQNDLDAAQAVIPLNFTDSVINKVYKQSSTAIVVKLPTKKPRPSRKSIFAYYVTAAVLTLFLMSGGVFDAMVDQSMHLSQVCMLQSQNIEAQVGKDWSTPIFKDSSQWRNNLTIEKERNVKDAK